MLSYSTIVLYSRDHQGLGVAHKLLSSKNQPHFSHMMMWQYWLGKTKPKSLQIDPMLSTSCYRILKIFYLIEFSTDCACLPSDSHNSTMAKAGYGLDFAVQCRFSPRGAFCLIAVHAMHSSWTYHARPSFVSHSSFFTTKSVDCTRWLPFATEIICSGYFDYFLNSC